MVAYTNNEIAHYVKLALNDEATEGENASGYNHGCADMITFLMIIMLMVKHHGTFELRWLPAETWQDALLVFEDIKMLYDTIDRIP